MTTNKEQPKTTKIALVVDTAGKISLRQPLATGALLDIATALRNMALTAVLPATIEPGMAKGGKK